jgi:hypothetical protein
LTFRRLRGSVPVAASARVHACARSSPRICGTENPRASGAGGRSADRRARFEVMIDALD